MSTNIGSLSVMMTSATSIDRGDRLPADVIEQAVRLSIRFPLSLRMVEDLLAARGIVVSHESGTKPCGAGQSKQCWMIRSRFRRGTWLVPARLLRHLCERCSTWCCQVDEVSTNIRSSSAMMTTSKSIDRGYRFPADVIEQAVWLSIRFPLSLRMVEDLLAARGIIVSHETVRCWAETFGRID